MAHSHDEQDEHAPPAHAIRLREPGSAGGIAEFIHALAAILARLDAEQQRRVQSDLPQNAKPERKESP